MDCGKCPIEEECVRMKERLKDSRVVEILETQLCPLLFAASQQIKTFEEIGSLLNDNSKHHRHVIGG